MATRFNIGRVPHARARKKRLPGTTTLPRPLAAITENEFGAGTLLYEGTYLSNKLQTAVLKSASRKPASLAPTSNSRPQSTSSMASTVWQAPALLLQLLKR